MWPLISVGSRLTSSRSSAISVPFGKGSSAIRWAETPEATNAPANVPPTPQENIIARPEPAHILNLRQPASGDPLDSGDGVGHSEKVKIDYTCPRCGRIGTEGEIGWHLFRYPQLLKESGLREPVCTWCAGEIAGRDIRALREEHEED
jgi:hypothetical protein